MKIKRLTYVLLASALVIGSVSGCYKYVKTDDNSDWINKDKFESIMLSLDEVINYRYYGYDSVDFKEKYGDVFSDELCYDLQSYFTNSSDYYDIEAIYMKNFNIWKKAVEADGGLLNEDLYVTRIEGETAGIETSESLSDEDEYTPMEVMDGYDGEESTIGVNENDVNVVREGDIAENPMESDIYNTGGEKIWEAKTPEEIKSMREDEIEAFNNLMSQNDLDLTAIYQGVVQEQIRIEQEKETYGMDTGDGDPDPSKDEHITTIADMETSEIVQVVDERHVISWRDILKGFDRDNNRLYFKVLGYQEYLDVANIGEFPASSALGNEDYKFERVDFELLDNKYVNVKYMSYYMGGLRYKIEITGEIKDEKLYLEPNQSRKIRDIFR